MENKNFQNKFYWVYLIGFFLILALPLINIPPWLSPPDWGKTIVFRIIFSLLIFFFIYQILFKKWVAFNISWTDLRNRSSLIFWPFWLLVCLLGLYLLATIFSFNPSFSFWGSPERGGGSLNFVLCGLFGIFVFLILRKSDWQKIWDFSLIIAGLISLIAVFQQFGIFSGFLVTTSRPYSSIGNTILLALYLLLLTFLVLSFGIKAKNIYKKIFYFSLFSLFLFVILISGTRAVYFGLTIGILYFLFFYPKKIFWIKITFGIFLILGVLGICYLNINSDKIFSSPYLVKNPTFSSLLSRFSFNRFIADPRFSAWKMTSEALKHKPIFGYGPENFGVAFDKYIEPSFPLIGGTWWDRAHNFVLDIGVTAGVPALAIYLLLIGVLFWHLQKLKTNRKSTEQPTDKNTDSVLVAHSIQATFVGYLATNFFSFDNFVTYLIFFLLVAYSLFLISSKQAGIINTNQSKILDKLKRHKKPIIVTLFILLIWFIWSFNIKPLKVNKEIQMAELEMKYDLCDKVLPRLEKTLPTNTFLNSYLRLKYVSVITKCIEIKPQSTIELSKKAISALKENIKTLPLYTRNWYYLGSYTNVLIEMGFAKDNQEELQNLKSEANYYFEKAHELSPKRQEIFLEWLKTGLLTEDYQFSKEKSERCIAANYNLGDCYWYLGLTEIFMNNVEKGKNDIALASQKGFNVIGFIPQSQLLLAFQKIENYDGLVEVYQNLISLKPSETQYYASLAFVYRELREYNKAREMVLKVSELTKNDPEFRKEAELFLKTLP